jgi:hypothetical protein
MGGSSGGSCEVSPNNNNDDEVELTRTSYCPFASQNARAKETNKC